MNLAPQFPIAGSASSCLARLAASAGLLALVACGGSTYSLGTVGGDGGPGTEGGRGRVCSAGSSGGCDGGDNYSGFSSVDGGTCPSGGACEGGGFDMGGTDLDAGTVTSECTLASATCSGGATGYQCGVGSKPEDVEPSLSCTSGAINGYHVDYCCFPWPGSLACTPFPSFPCDGNSYAYQCSPGTLPSSIDSMLSCGSSFPDSNGKNNFCCTYQ